MHSPAFKYPVTIHPDPDGGFVAEIRDLPGCITQSESWDDIQMLVDDAQRAWIEVVREHGDEIPMPTGVK